MDSVAPQSAVNILITAAVVVGALVAVYYLYGYLYGVTGLQTTSLLGREVPANRVLTDIPNPPQIYEGGDYTVSLWLYVNSYNINRNRRKHILQLGGSNFTTLLVALGAFKNNLIVRTHSREADAAYTAAAQDNSGNKAGLTTPNSADATRTDGSLSTADVTAFFKPMAMDDSLLDSSPICDLPEIDLQRWTNVTIVLSGRVIDVYLDGKLARSCVSKSYFKVDPTGVKLKMLERPGSDGEPGFDGHLSNVSASNFALSPSDIYRIYANGPFGKATDVLSWAGGLFSSNR